MYRAQNKWAARHQPLYFQQKQKEYPGAVGTEKVQPHPEKGNRSQGNQVNWPISQSADYHIISLAN
jgi:hypothetical protein